MIELEGIEKSYVGPAGPTLVLKGVSFRIEAGEYVALMGASGTGKTTLMNILGCLDRPTAGRYRLGGADVSTLDDDALARLRNHKVGFVFQQFHLLDRASAIQNVLLPLIYADEYPANARDLAAQALAAVDLSDRADYTPRQLSGGQQQRVAIARALVMDPAILLADEPTGNLDRASGLEVLAVFQRLHREGRTLLLVTHNAEVAQHAQRVIVLKDGAVAEDRPVESPRDAAAERAALAKEAAR